MPISADTYSISDTDGTVKVVDSSQTPCILILRGGGGLSRIGSDPSGTAISRLGSGTVNYPIPAGVDVYVLNESTQASNYDVLRIPTSGSSGAFEGNSIELSDDPEPLNPVDSEDALLWVSVRNKQMRVGGSNVTPSFGFMLSATTWAGQSPIRVAAGDVLYAVRNSGQTDVIAYVVRVTPAP